MEFKRLNKNSKLKLCGVNELTQNFISMLEEENIILQIVDFSRTIKSIDNSECYIVGIIVEYLPREAQEQSAVSFERDIEFDNALDTIINNDPFGAKYSGKPIRCIFDNGDNEWLDKALNLMHNEFIRKKLEYIVARGGYGKIKR